MMKSMYLFVDSERPDQYLNSVVHGILNDGVRSVFFWHLRRPDGDEQPVPDGYSGRVMSDVQGLLSSLADRAEYIERKRGTVPLSDIYNSEDTKRIQEYYALCRSISVSYTNEDRPYNTLRQRIRQICENAPYVCDVTGLRKRYLGDIVAAGLVENLQGLFIFDLLDPPNFDQPWTMLIHNSDHPNRRRYRFVDLLNTEVYRACSRSVAVRAPAVLILVAISALMIGVGLVLTLWLGPNSSYAKYLNYISQLAGVAGLVISFVSLKAPK